MIDPADVRKDMYPGSAPGPLDQRIVRGGWTYYVRATKKPRSLTHDADAGAGAAAGTVGGLFGLLAMVPLVLVVRVRDRSRPWTVAVIRMGHVASWNDLKPTVLHREKVAPGDSPANRIAALTHEVRAGRFEPE